MDWWEITKIAFGVLVVAATVFYFTKSVKEMFYVATGLAALETANGLIDFGIWPAVQGCFGTHGVIGLVIFVLIFNFVILMLYQKSKRDWVGITIVDKILMSCDKFYSTYSNKQGFKKVLWFIPLIGVWIVERAIRIRVIPFMVLTIYMDSFFATAFWVYRRSGKMNTALKKTDYVIFIASTILSCCFWTWFNAVAIIPAFTKVWHTFSG